MLPIVPLDPAYPADRLAFIAKDAGLRLLLTKGQSLGFEANDALFVVDTVVDTVVDIEDISPDLPTHNLNTPIAPSDLAYVIYTSGSTGRPKGVAIEHCSTVTLLHWAKEQFSPAERSSVLASTSICFDLSVFENILTR